MGFLQKLKFWKKDEDDLFTDIGTGSSLGPSGTDTTAGLGGTGSIGQYPESETIRGPDFGLGKPEQYLQSARQTPAPQQYPSQQSMMDKDLQIISSKLDAIKALVDHINQRLENLEHSGKTKELSRGW